MSLKPWREIAIPHEDVLKGTFQQAEFAADISRVHDGSATPEYQNPTLFFQRTFITEGMRLLLGSVVRRLSGKGGDPVIQLQTAFGGGKTHTMLAVYHIAKGQISASDLPGVAPLLDAAGVTEMPKARVVVLDGIQLSPNQPIMRGALTIRTLWGDLAWQLGGDAAYAKVADADASGTSPGKDVLTKLLAEHAPCVILVDELVAYIRQFEEGKQLTGGSFDSNLSFIQALTEAMKAVPTAVMLASLPESEREAGSSRGVRALEALAHYFGRVQALWKPVATEEAFEIVRRRLFAVNDRTAAEEVCRRFAEFYLAHASDFPSETQDSKYLRRLIDAYPIHPEVFDRLYEDWSALDNFQRTRGVLKLMAKVIHGLWRDGSNDPLIMPGSLPLYDGEVRNEMVNYLTPGWDPVLERDIDGPRAETTEIENREPLMGALQACRRAGRTLFLGSAPSGVNQVARGLDATEVLLGCAMPGQPVGRYRDALNKLHDRLHYLNSANSHYWFDTRPNLRREMEERKRRFSDREDVFPTIHDRIQRSLSQGVFGGVHIFTSSADVPDDWSLRLVVLPPDTPFVRSGASPALDRATEVLKNRGDQPRQKQNRLLFVAADQDSVSRLKDQVRSVLAWQSILNDSRDLKLNLDQFQARQAQQALEGANDALRRMVREAYKWLLVPMQDAKPGKGVSELKWEHHPLNAGAPNFVQEIERALKDNELLISEWAPIHLSNMLCNWFWKDGAQAVSALETWQKTCCYLYLPRLLDDNVFRHTLAAGAVSKNFFAFAYGRDEACNYLGFSWGEKTSPVFDNALLLIEPSAADAFAETLRLEAEAKAAVAPPSVPPVGGKEESAWVGVCEPGNAPYVAVPATPSATPEKRRFYGLIDLNPVLAKKQFADLVDEVAVNFTTKPGVKVSISIEIHADAGSGSFDDSTQRAVRENCRTLQFKTAEFE